MVDFNQTITFTPGGQVQPQTGGPGDLNDQLIAQDWWTDDLVQQAGIPIVDVPFVTVGGGWGSFILVDNLRIAGVPTEAIKVLTNIDKPYATYAFLCNNSQIPLPERLRSDSGSTPDNIWGFPAYALREAWREKTIKPLVNVFVEPVFKDYWTPRAGTVFDDTEREMARIRWASMLEKGQVRMVRRRVGGGYFTILTPPTGTTRTKRIAYRSQWVHISVGYPALRYLKDLQTYRETYQDYTRVVNAYEPHEHIYEDLKRRPGIVMVRGAGIVASRILQRLIDDRDHHGAQTLILHLFRTYRTQPKHNRKYGRGKQPVKDGWAYQGFNITKSSWGGVDRYRLFKASNEERKEIIDYIGGGAHTPNRKDWKEQLERGKQQGFYRQHVGEVVEVVPGPDGDSVVSRIRGQDGSVTDIPSRYVIDCTGLIGSPRDSRLLADVLDHDGAQLNALGRIWCGEAFEVLGADSVPGRLYMSGAATAGSTFGGVDSFLGLQYCAVQIHKDLARQGFGKYIGPGRSISHWWKWVRNTQI